MQGFQVLLGLLLAMGGVVLVVVGRARNGLPRPFIERSRLAQTFYAPVCLALIALGLAWAIFAAAETA